MQYISQQKQIHRSAEEIYLALSKFSNFTHIIGDKVEGWQATDTTCSFKVKGFSIGLIMSELTPFTSIKIIPDENGAPAEFKFWVQLNEVELEDTRMRLVMDVQMNVMMKMMIGNKIQGAIDSLAEHIALGLNK